MDGIETLSSRPLQDEENGEEEPVCFVCMEPCEAEQGRQCACKNQRVHHTCLVRWLEQKKVNTCPVCKEEYKHIEVQIKTSYFFTVPCWSSVIAALCFLVLLICGSLLLSWFANPRVYISNEHLAAGLMMVAFSLLGLWTAILFCKRWRADRWRIWEARCTKRVVVRPLM